MYMQIALVVAVILQFGAFFITITLVRKQKSLHYKCMLTKITTQRG